MKVQAVCFVPFRGYLGIGESEFELEDKITVLGFLKQLFRSSESRKKLLDETGRPRDYVSILKNGRSIKKSKRS